MLGTLLSLLYRLITVPDRWWNLLKNKRFLCISTTIILIKPIRTNNWQVGLLLKLTEDGTWVPQHVGIFYVLCILYHEVHLLENILKILQCSLACCCPPCVEFRFGILCFGFLAKDLLISCLSLSFPPLKYWCKLLKVSEFAKVYNWMVFLKQWLPLERKLKRVKKTNQDILGFSCWRAVWRA